MISRLKGEKRGGGGGNQFLYLTPIYRTPEVSWVQHYVVISDIENTIKNEPNVNNSQTLYKKVLPIEGFIERNIRQRGNYIIMAELRTENLRQDITIIRTVNYSM